MTRIERTTGFLECNPTFLDLKKHLSSKPYTIIFITQLKGTDIRKIAYCDAHVR